MRHVHYYIGNGKGKTSAAVGQAVRAAGHGWRVCFTQFMKNNTSGEIEVLESIKGIDVIKGKPIKSFYVFMDEAEKNDVYCNQNSHLEKIISIAGKFDMLILDEISDAVELGIIDLDKLIDFINSSRSELEIVMTGHTMNEAIVETCDYVTEMKSKKHPYEKGVSARKGIEF